MRVSSNRALGNRNVKPGRNRPGFTLSDSLRVLVMSGHVGRRGDWARYIQAFGARTLQCAGPLANTCALSIGNRCGLHDAVDVIFYDRDSVTPELEAQLQRLPPEALVVFARSERDAEGRGFPVVGRIFLGARPER